MSNKTTSAETALLLVDIDGTELFRLSKYNGTSWENFKILFDTLKSWVGATNLWYDGVGAPGGGLGNNGDYYLNTTSGDVYKKIAGIWTIEGNIKGANGTNGTDGVFGGDSMPYLFDNTLTTTPANTKISFDDNTTPTLCYIKNINGDSVDVTTWLDALALSTSQTLGRIRIFSEFDSAKFIDFAFKVVTPTANVYELSPVTILASNNLPFSNNESLVVSFSSNGDKGDTGADGSNGVVPIAIAGGSVDAITATYTPALTLADLTMCAFVASGANATTTPTFSPDGLTAHTIVKKGGQALVAGDIPNALAVCLLQYNLANTRWELLNPATSTASVADASETVKGVVEEATQAEMNAYTDTGGTGAKLFVVPSKIKTWIQQAALTIDAVWHFVSAKFRLFNSAKTFYAQFETAATANRTITIQDKDTTVADLLDTIQVATATGTVNVITATYTKPLTLTDKMKCSFVASGENTISGVTFNPDGLGAKTITKYGGSPLVVGDIPGALAVCLLQYNLANTRWELLNPAVAAHDNAYIINKSTADVSLTGSTAETLMYSFAIPANTLSSGKILNIKARCRKTGTAGTWSVRFRFHTSAAVAGSQVALYSNGATILYSQLERMFLIKTATTVESWQVATTTASDTNQSTGAVTSTTVNLTVDLYVIITIQLSSAADTAYFSGYYLEII